MIVPPTVALGIRSFIRSKQRRIVDFPQPDGPMNAVISFTGIFMVTSSTAGLPA